MVRVEGINKKLLMEPPSLVIPHFEGIEKTKQTMERLNIFAMPQSYMAQRVYESQRRILTTKATVLELSKN